MYDAPWGPTASAGWVLAGLVAVLLAACAVRTELRPAGRGTLDHVLLGATAGAVVALLAVLALVVVSGLG